MYHLVIENLGEKKCLAVSPQDDFEDGLYIDCTQDFGCIPGKFIREIHVTCAGDKPVRIKARIFSD